MPNALGKAVFAELRSRLQPLVADRRKDALNDWIVIHAPSICGASFGRPLGVPAFGLLSHDRLSMKFAVDFETILMLIFTPNLRS